MSPSVPGRDAFQPFLWHRVGVWVWTRFHHSRVPVTDCVVLDA